MAKAGNGARLTFESLSNFRCVSYPLSENLDGDRAVQARISRPIHFSHASSAEERFNLVGTEFRSGSESHSCARLYPGASFCEGCNCSDALSATRNLCQTTLKELRVVGGYMG